MSDEVDAIPFKAAKGREHPAYPTQKDVLPMPTSVVSGGKTTFTYKMDHGKRGVFILINNKNFSLLGEREGTDKDAKNLTERFEELGFEVKRHNNKTCKEMEKIMSEAAQEDHSDSDCFACAILTHGADKEMVYGTDDKIDIERLIQPFKGHNCRSLLNKPKLFIIQACRGDMADDGVEVECDGIDETDSDDIEQKPNKIPVEKDILRAFSSVAGYYSWRNKSTGSCFINALCQVLQDYGEKEEIMVLLTRTNNAVASEFESKSENKNSTGKKQMPQFVSTLTKQLFFAPKLSVLQTTEQLWAMSTK